MLEQLIGTSDTYHTASSTYLIVSDAMIYVSEAMIYVSEAMRYVSAARRYVSEAIRYVSEAMHGRRQIRVAERGGAGAAHRHPAPVRALLPGAILAGNVTNFAPHRALMLFVFGQVNF